MKIDNLQNPKEDLTDPLVKEETNETEVKIKTSKTAIIWTILLTTVVIAGISYPFLHDVLTDDCNLVLEDYEQMCLDVGYTGYVVQNGLIYCSTNIAGSYQEITFDMNYYNSYVEAKCGE